MAVAFRGSVSSSRPSNRACGSPAHGLPTSFTAGIPLVPPGLASPGLHDDSVKPDQTELVGRKALQCPTAEVAAAAMALAEPQRDPHPHVLSDLAETLRRVSITEVPGPTAQERVDVLHDHLNGQQQPTPGGEFPDPVAGVLHGLIRGPAGEEGERALPAARPGCHQPVVEAEEVHAFSTDLEVHDPGLGFLR